MTIYTKFMKYCSTQDKIAWKSVAFYYATRNIKKRLYSFLVRKRALTMHSFVIFGPSPSIPLIVVGDFVEYVCRSLLIDLDM